MKGRSRSAGCLSIAVAAAAVTLAMSVGGAAPAGAAPGDHIYLVLGDSISYGLATKNIDDSFAGRLYDDFQTTRGADLLDNRALPGATARSGRRNQLSSALLDIEGPSDTVALTVGFGANEALAGTCVARWDVCSFRRNLDFILAKLTAALDADPGEEFVAVLSYFNPRVGTTKEKPFNANLLGDDRRIGCGDAGAEAGLNDVIFQEAGDYGLPVASTFGPMREAGRAAMAGDHIHPNKTGHAIIAQAFRNSAPRCPATPDEGPRARSLRCEGRATIAAVPGEPTTGTSHRDVISGTPGPDRIWAGGGDDLVCASEGGDDVSGGAGHDTISGGRGEDQLRGQGGPDILFGQLGRDRLLGGAGPDGLLGGSGRDRLLGGPGRNQLVQ